MRNCIRCNTPMVEDLTIRPTDANALTIWNKGMFAGSLGKVVCAVCPNCGYVETYVADTEKLKKLQKNG